VGASGHTDRTMSNHVDRFLLNWAADEPDRTAVAAPGRRYSYGDLTEAAEAYALALEELGLGRGDRLVVVIEPCFEAVALLCACSRLGVIWTPISP
ncbi:MAG: AMP-binding protein, partial [Rhodospirillales bacterium]|nr:AMP-binding protein [Rhodospirillales bacterium]